MGNFSESRVSLANRGTAVGKVMNPPASFACYVMIEGVNVTARILGAVTVVQGDTAMLVKYNQSWFIVGTVKAPPAVPPTPAATPPDNPPSSGAPPRPNPTSRSGQLIVAATQTATYQDGTWRRDIVGLDTAGDTYQGALSGFGNNTGCAFYGVKPRSLVGATVTRARLRVQRLSGGPAAPRQVTLWLVTENARPVGAPTLTSTTAGPTLTINEVNDGFDIPTSWAQGMVNSTAGGLAIFTAAGVPYVRLAGRASWSPAWTLTIDWVK